MKLSEAFGTDTNMESEGKWFDIGDGAEIRVARFGNRNHRKALSKLRAPYKPLLLRGGQIPDDANDDIITESIAQAVLIDWKGLLDEDGIGLPHSIDNAREALTKYKDFLELVSQLSLDAANFRTELQEEIIKK